MDRIVCIPCRGRATRVDGIAPNGNKLLMDVAGETVLKRQLRMVFPHHTLVMTLPEHEDQTRRHIAGSIDKCTVAAFPEVKHDGPALSMRLCINYIKNCWRGFDGAVTFLFSDTLFYPGTSLIELTVPGSIVVQRVEDGSRFLNVETTPNGRIVGWIDHPESTAPALAMVGLATLYLKEWDRILAEFDPRSFMFFSKAHYAIAVETNKWLDVGTIESYHQTCEILKSQDRFREKGGSL